MTLGDIELEKGAGELTLRATEIPGNEVMSFRLLLLKRLYCSKAAAGSSGERWLRVPMKTGLHFADLLVWCHVGCD